MADEDKKPSEEEKPKESAAQSAKKEVVRDKRAKRFVVNLIISTILITIIGIILNSFNLQRVFYMVLAGMLPSIVAHIIDTRPGHFASKTVMAFNGAGVLPHLGGVLTSGSPNQTAAAIMMDAEPWVLMWGFAAFGWLVVYLIPNITQLYLEVTATYKIKKMQIFQDTLVDEWGDVIKKPKKGRRKA